jgi:hypothetical protein
VASVTKQGEKMRVLKLAGALLEIDDKEKTEGIIRQP